MTMNPEPYAEHNTAAHPPMPSVLSQLKMEAHLLGLLEACTPIGDLLGELGVPLDTLAMMVMHLYAEGFLEMKSTI